MNEKYKKCLQRLREIHPGHTIDLVTEDMDKDQRLYIVVDGNKLTVKWRKEAAEDMLKIHGLDLVEEILNGFTKEDLINEPQIA